MRSVLEIRLEGMNRLSTMFAYNLSDRLIDYNAFALVKNDVVAVDLSHVSMDLTLDKVIEIIHDCMDSLGLRNSYTLTIENDKLVIKITNPRIVEELSSKYRDMQNQLYMCPHCGYVTSYPELLREHIKIHYLL